jgi:hypothetical protein
MRRRLGHEGAGERSRAEARRGAAGGGAKASGHGEAGVEARRGRRRGEAGSARRSHGGGAAAVGSRDAPVGSREGKLDGWTAG